MNGKGLLAASLLLIVWAGAPVAAGPRGEAVVAEDAAGDWGGIEPLAPLGDALGQDLVSASLRSAGGTIEFTWTVSSLGDTSLRSGTYTWDFLVDGRWWRLTNFVCDPTQYVSAGAAAPESCVPTASEGETFEVFECGVERLVNVFANCAFRATAAAAVEPAAGRITVPVPAQLLGARRGSVISPADVPAGDITARLGGPHGGAMPAAGDSMSWEKSFRIR